MRVLVWAATFGAIVGSANAGGATASPLHPSHFAEQFPDRTFELVARAISDHPRETESVFESWISAAFFSSSDYETLSSMTGFHDVDMLAQDADPASLQIFAQRLAENVSFVARDFEWDAVDLLPSPAVLAGFAVPERRFLVDDEDSLTDVAHTGSTGFAASSGIVETGLALDGYEDR
jgi:hypothetical protein